MSRRALHPVVLIAALALGACAKGDYLGAAVTAGLGVAGAGAHRATTKGCWGQCLNGLVCDHESGTCIAPPRCGGRCRRDETCEEGTVARCIPIAELPASTSRDIEGKTDSGVADANVSDIPRDE